MKALLFIIGFFLSFTSFTKPKKPNVIYILTDQWRSSSLGYTGNNVVKTPFVDQFSKESVNFKNAVSVLPVCTPHRAALLTGRYPTTTGMIVNDLYLPSEEVCMAEIFKENNYNTAYLGKWHLDGHGRKKNVIPQRRQGFEFWQGSECDHDYNNEHYYENDDPVIKYWQGYSPYAISDAANKYLESRQHVDKPFLLLVSLGTPHFPHDNAPKDIVAKYPKESLKLDPNVPDSIKNKVLTELQGYYAHCTATDIAIGKIIQKLKDLRLYDNSIIVFTSDHGAMMGAHGYRPYMKQQFYAESAEVPFLISYPGINKNKGKVSQAPITTPDILPTLLSMCNIKIAKTIEGYDLSNLVRKPNKGHDRAALYMNPCPFNIAWDDKEYRAIKTSKYTYVRTVEGPAFLFDNTSDPYQLNNLINTYNYAKVQAKLDKTLLSEMHRIGDKEVYPRDYYLTNFGFKGLKEFNQTYSVKNFNDVKNVITPNQKK